MEDRQHHVLEALEVFRRPPAVAAHDLGRVRELVAIDARCQEPIRVADDRGQRARPCVEEDDRLVGVSGVLRDLPAQGQLVGACDVDVHLREVRTIASPHHLRGRGAAPSCERPLAMRAFQPSVHGCAPSATFSRMRVKSASVWSSPGWTKTRDAPSPG
jgi:hypothetical protein